MNTYLGGFQMDATLSNKYTPVASESPRYTPQEIRYKQTNSPIMKLSSHNGFPNTSISSTKYVTPLAAIHPRPLSKLLLGRNKFMSIGVLPILGLLHTGYPLHYLSINDCGIGTMGMSSVLHTLSFHPYLRGLDIRYNYGFRHDLHVGQEVEEKYGGDSTYYSIHPSLNSLTQQSLLQSSYFSLPSSSKADANVNM